jgi:hypothetical protein
MFRIAYLFVAGQFGVQNQSLDIIVFLSLRMRALLAPLDADDHFSHHLEFLPIDSRFVFTHEGFITFLRGDQVSAV